MLIKRVRSFNVDNVRINVFEKRSSNALSSETNRISAIAVGDAFTAKTNSAHGGISSRFIDVSGAKPPSPSRKPPTALNKRCESSLFFFYQWKISGSGVIVVSGINRQTVVQYSEDSTLRTHNARITTIFMNVFLFSRYSPLPVIFAQKPLKIR